jgi:acetate kinase
MSQHVLTLNAGSSSIKFALFAAPEGRPTLRASGLIESLSAERRMSAKAATGETLLKTAWPATAGSWHAEGMRRVIAWMGEAFPDATIAAVGHRVVHGGMRRAKPARVDAALREELATLVPLAPLHQPHNLAGIDAATEAFPAVPQVACFDTAFHHGHPFVNDAFALPRALYEEGVRRYGFHGLSYEYVTAKLREIAPMHAAGRVVVAHLGNGASMCGIRDGFSIASTMGFTALDGLPMGTRCGQLDPGVVLYLMQQKGLDAAAVSDLLYRQSGLLGLSGVSHDMRELEASPRPEAKEAIDYFVFRIRRELGGLAAVLEGLDAMVFCGGIGENATTIRARVLHGLEWLGIECDDRANAAGETVISTHRSRVEVFVIRTDEEQMIARHALAVLGG